MGVMYRKIFRDYFWFCVQCGHKSRKCEACGCPDLPALPAAPLEVEHTCVFVRPPDWIPGVVDECLECGNVIDA